MSKVDRIIKTRRLKMKRSPKARLERMTELRREIKHHKSTIPQLRKEAENLEKAARWRRAEYEGTLETLIRLEKELDNLLSYEEKGDEDATATN